MSTYPLLDQLETAGIVGRGGAAFPTHLKLKRLKELNTPIGYVVCNASEGELNVKKDAYILKHFPDKIVAGMIATMDFLDIKEAYFNINRHYYNLYGPILKKIIDRVSQKQKKLFHFYIEDPSYIGGETGALLNSIEGGKAQPRLSPPSASIAGIHGKPVLLSNVETYFDIARVVEGTFEPTRYVTMTGPIVNSGVFCVNRDLTVMQTLEQTHNTPDFDFFVQVGGSASGEVISKSQTNTHLLTGCGAIEVFKTDTRSQDMLMRWFEFYFKESCGKCTPCREGTYQLYTKLKQLQPGELIPWDDIRAIMNTMKTTSFCDLGKSLPIPVESYMKNILGLEV